MTHAPNSGIEELYRSVIEDVIEQSKEAFLDENVDVDILTQIKKAWEEKINASGAADLNPKVQPTPVVRPAQVKPLPTTRPGSSNRPPSMVNQEAPSTSNTQQQQHQQYTTAADLPQFRNAAGGAIQLQGLQYLQNNMGQFVVSGNPGNLPPNVMLLPVQLSGNSSGQSVIQMTQEQLNQLPQNDGESFIPDLEDAEISLDLKAGTLIIDTSKAKNGKSEYEKKVDGALENMKNLGVKEKRSKKKKRTLNLAMVIPQVDGGPHMSDSSSDEDEDDDPLSRMVNRIDDKGEEEGDDDGGDEDPLNSADDQSDDEDLDTLFESSNIIVCQFEKVNRARNKWKFTLKDGIMHLDGKDYCFQKCTGEAEW